MSSWNCLDDDEISISSKRSVKVELQELKLSRRVSDGRDRLRRTESIGELTRIKTPEAFETETKINRLVEKKTTMNTIYRRSGRKQAETDRMINKLIEKVLNSSSNSLKKTDDVSRFFFTFDDDDKSVSSIADSVASSSSNWKRENRDFHNEEGLVVKAKKDRRVSRRWSHGSVNKSGFITPEAFETEAKINRLKERKTTINKLLLKTGRKQSEVDDIINRMIEKVQHGTSSSVFDDEKKIPLVVEPIIESPSHHKKEEKYLLFKESLSMNGRKDKSREGTDGTMEKRNSRKILFSPNNVAEIDLVDSQQRFDDEKCSEPERIKEMQSDSEIIDNVDSFGYSNVSIETGTEKNVLMERENILTIPRIASAVGRGTDINTASNNNTSQKYENEKSENMYSSYDRSTFARKIEGTSVVKKQQENSDIATRSIIFDEDIDDVSSDLSESQACDISEKSDMYFIDDDLLCKEADEITNNRRFSMIWIAIFGIFVMLLGICIMMITIYFRTDTNESHMNICDASEDQKPGIMAIS